MLISDISVPLEASPTEVALKSCEVVSTVDAGRGWWSYPIAKTFHFCSLLMKPIDEFLKLRFLLINHFSPSDFQILCIKCIDPSTDFTETPTKFFYLLD
jgi:hypothetical protein